MYYALKHPGLTSRRLEWPSARTQEGRNAGVDVQGMEPGWTLRINVNWCSHHGEQYGESSRN